MARDVLITPASGLVDFLDTSVSKASITLGTDGILTLTGGVNPIVFQTSTSGSSVLRVDGTSGTIFEVTDDLSNSLMSVNTIAGLPVFEVFADNHIVAGRYNQNDFYLDTNGNLGLGTSAPSSVLDVYEQSGKDNKLRFHSSTTGSGTSNGSRIGLNGAELFINNIENNAIKIYTQSTQTNGITILGSGLVGIGTTGPDNPLDVSSELSTIASFRATGGASNNKRLEIGSGGDRTIFKSYCDTTDAAAEMAFQAGDSEAMRIVSDGKVGIGTTDPAGKLHIYNTAETSDRDGTATPTASGQDSILLYGHGGFDTRTYGAITWMGGTRRRAMITAVAENNDVDYLGLAFYTQGVDGAGDFNESMRISHGGNVGIGTTGPDACLHVNGDTHLQVGGTTGGRTAVLGNSRYTDGGSLNYRSYWSYDSYWDDTTCLWNAKRTTLGRKWKAEMSYHDDHFQISRQGDVCTTWANSDWSNFFTINNVGNVGINNTVSQAYTNEGTRTVKLRIGSDTLTSNQSSALQIGGHDSSGSATLGAIEFFNHRDDSIIAKIQVRRDLESSSKLSAGQIDFYTDDGDNNLNLQMSIDALGKVGIGTASPSSKLHIFGADNNSAKITLTNTATSPDNQWSLHAGYNDQSLRFLGDSTTVMTLLDSGNVGIGTTSPEDKLDVVGGLRISANKTANTNKTNRIKGEHYDITEEPTTFMYMNNFASSNILYIGGGSSVENAATQLNFYTAGNNTTTTGTARMVIIPSGNIGIGTGDPDEKLHVRGEQVYLYNDIDTNNTYFYARNSSSGNAGIKMKNSQGEWTIIANDRLRFYDDDNSIERFTILSSGNVGIGTVSPAYTLQVQGTGYFSSNLLSSGLTAQTNSNYIRESSDQIRYLSRINGRNINHNAQFINGTASGYNLYNNSGGSATSISVIYYTGDTAISTSAIPNSNGYVLKISYTSGAGNTSPGFGGFYLGTTNSETINADKNYKQKNRIIHRIWAKIPSGKTLAFASNAYGTNGSFTWLTPTGGNGDWYEYIGVQQIGYGGSFGSTSYFYVSGGSNTSFDWYVAECSLIDVDCPSDILYSPGLSIGYASGASYNSIQAGWGGLGVKNNAIIGGSVGIGTVSPSAKLQVNAAIPTVYANVVPSVANTILAISNTQTSETTNDQAQIQFGVNGGTHNRVGSIGLIAEDATNRKAALVFATDDAGTRAEKMRITGDGNVGIGTLLPKSPLTVQSDDNANSIQIYGRTSDDNSDIDFYANDTTTRKARIFIDSEGFNISGQASGASNLLIDSSGNVGIGITNPGAKLAVKDGQVTIYDNLSSPTYGDGSQARLRVGRGASQSISFEVSDLNNTITAYQDEGGTESHRFILNRTSSTSGVHDFHIARNGSYQVTVDRLGNVGIGTTSPEGKLHVFSASAGTVTASSVADELVLEGSGDSGLTVLSPDNKESNIFLGGPGLNYGGMLRWKHSDLKLTLGTNVSNSFIAFNTGTGTERMRIAADGHVGIGTPSPSSKLDVNGMIKAGIAGNASANIPALLVSSAGTNTNQSAIAIQQGTNEGDTIIFADYEPYVEYGLSTDNGLNTIEFTGGTTTNNLGSKTLYNQSGNARTAYKKVIVELLSGDMSVGGSVGIGTVTPSQKLHVVGKALITDDVQLTGSNPRIDFNTNGASSLRFYDTTNTAERMRINTSGNLGINTTSPNSKLQIVGSTSGDSVLKVDGTNGTLFEVVDDLSDSLMSVNDAAGLPVFEVFADNTIVGGRYNQNDFYLDGTSGNVGIGTASPTAKLQVNGDATVDGDLSAGGSAAANRTLTINSVAQTGRPAAKINNPNLDTATASNGRTFHGWLPIDLDGTVKYIPVYN
jgi:hypothetical protein